MNQKTVYLVPNSDDTWTTKVSDTLPVPGAAALCKEGTYPVDVYYSRMDLNGSRVYEQDICQNREELLQSLNWIGRCGYVPLSVWEYQVEKPMENVLSDILDKAYDRGAKLRQQALSEMEELSDREPLDVLIEKAESVAKCFDGTEPPDRAPEI